MVLYKEANDQSESYPARPSFYKEAFHPGLAGSSTPGPEGPFLLSLRQGKLGCSSLAKVNLHYLYPTKWKEKGDREEFRISYI